MRSTKDKYAEPVTEIDVKTIPDGTILKPSALRQQRSDKPNDSVSNNNGTTAEKPKFSFGQKPVAKKTNVIVATDEDRKHAKLPVYDSSRLKVRPLPEDIADPTVIEQHLSDDEFHEIFKMGRAAFDALPKWKKLTVKKDSGIF